MKRISVLLIVIFSVLSLGSVEARSDDFGYNKRDKTEEKRKFIIKLNEDRKKVDMAIESTKSLIDKSRSRPYLPELYLRLSELYVEKSRIVYFLRRAQVSGSAKSLDQLESNSLKNQAIELYQRILGNFPDYQDRDKVRFFMAHEYRELGQIDEMVKQYRAIVKEHKESRYIPEAYLLLGDYFLNNQDLDSAQKHYQSVLDYPGSSAVAVARYKLAWCLINKAEFKKAIKLLEESVTSISDKKLDIDTYKELDIRLEALVDMAYCYCESYKEKKPQDAIAYFQKYAWSRPVYTIVLEKLAYRYLIKKKWSHASVIYRQLSTLQHDTEKLLEYARHIFECVREIGTFVNADRDMAYIIKALKKQKYSVHISEEEKEKNLADYELYARDIVTHLHQKAREGKSVSDFKYAADSYKLYLDFFDDSLVYEEMEANYAEALFSAKEYLEAGRQYEKLATRTPQINKERDEKLYGAVISYYNALKHKKNLNYYQVAYARGGLKTTGRLYVDDFPDSHRVPNVLFNVAWVTYDEGKHDESIAEFSKFVERYPRGKEAKVAVHLILDAFHMKEDYEGLINYGRKILRNDKIAKELKGEVVKIVQAAESKVISSLTVAAVNDWDKGKTNLIEYAEEKQATGLGEQALNALLISGKERGDLEVIFSAGSKLIKQYPESAAMKDSLNIMIDSCLKTSQFRLVAGYLEEFAAKLPTHDNTYDFLYQAGRIRENLGQYDLANKNYQRLLRNPKKKTNGEEKIIFVIAENSERKGDIDSAINILIKNREKFSKTDKVKADVMVANLYLRKGEIKKTAKYRKRAYRAYRTKYGKEDNQINTIMAEMVYNVVHSKNEKYMNIQLQNQIDNKIVTAKAKLLGEIEKGYNEVIRYKSHKWALAACYGSYEINKEFARFLREAPLPELAPEQREQYVQIIQQKARAYTTKADQYLQTCIKQAHNWEVCDPDLTQYFINSSDQSGKSRGVDSFSESSPSSEIDVQCLRDEALKSLHYTLMQDPKNTETLLALAEAYMEKGDYRHSVLIAQKILKELEDKNVLAKAVTYNILGVSYLHVREDKTAKDAFKKALAIDPENIGAKINLAGLFQHYSHTDKANNIYETLPGNGIVEDLGGLIHPRAKELYHVHSRISKK